MILSVVSNTVYKIRLFSSSWKSGFWKPGQGGMMSTVTASSVKEHGVLILVSEL